MDESVKTTIRVHVGDWGEYVVPDEVYNKVKRWKKSGWPYMNDKGRTQYLQWVARVEGESINSRAGGE